MFKKHFIIPTRILERETRKENNLVEAMEVRDLGKNLRREEKIPTTSDWIVKLSPKNQYFRDVNVTRKYLDESKAMANTRKYFDESKANGELVEKVSEKFCKPILKKPLVRKKEQSYTEKKAIKFDSSQQKINKFLQISDDKIVLSTSPFDYSESCNSRGHRSSSNTPRESSSSPTEILSGFPSSRESRSVRSNSTWFSRKRGASNLLILPVQLRPDQERRRVLQAIAQPIELIVINDFHFYILVDDPVLENEFSKL